MLASDSQFRWNAWNSLKFVINQPVSWDVINFVFISLISQTKSFLFLRNLRPLAVRQPETEAVDRCICRDLVGWCACRLSHGFQVEDVPLDDSSEGSGNSPPAPSPQAESSVSLRFLPAYPQAKKSCVAAVSGDVPQRMWASRGITGLLENVGVDLGPCNSWMSCFPCFHVDVMRLLQVVGRWKKRFNTTAFCWMCAPPIDRVEGRFFSWNVKPKRESV